MAFGEVFGLVSAMFLLVYHTPCQVPAACQLVMLKDSRYCGCLPVEQLQQPGQGDSAFADTPGSTQLSGPIRRGKEPALHSQSRQKLGYATTLLHVDFKCLHCSSPGV